MKTATNPQQIEALEQPTRAAKMSAQPTRILAIATNPVSGASTRFRVLQWCTRLARAGFSLTLDAFYSEEANKTLYQPRHRLAKLAHFMSGMQHRMISLAHASQRADLLFIHRELFPFGLPVGFMRARQFPGPIVYDYDDAMFLPQRQDRRLLARCENLHTPSELMRISKLVLAGNQFLATYARQYAPQVIVLPTCIDTERFRPVDSPRLPGRLLTVGWIGSHSTAKYLESLCPVLEQVARRISFRLFTVGSSRPLHLKGVEVEQVPWMLTNEVADFLRCDIGIYPLWDDLWSQGKCGFKAIQFMACGVPIVASAVGVNREIIQDGSNGFLASSPEEWVHKLSRLLSESDLRMQFRQAARHTIVERYSVDVHAPRLIEALRQATQQRDRS